MKILGLDGGIANIGWAIIEFDIEKRLGSIVGAGTRSFDSGEKSTSSGSVIKNAERRTFRGQRRVIRRRAQRMQKIRELLAEHKLLVSSNRDALGGHGFDPWKLRSEALDHSLTPFELAVILGHIAKHRGFKSNKKGQKAKEVESKKNKPDEDQKMLIQIEETREKLAKYRTVGEMIAKDEAFATRKRNGEKILDKGKVEADFSRSVLRDDQVIEIDRIFEAQQRFNNSSASHNLKEDFKDIAFYQRPLASSLELVGDCQFIEGEKRCSSFAPSFERFRLLSKLTNMRIIAGNERRLLTREEISVCLQDYGSTSSYTYKKLRAKLSLSKDERFEGVSPDKEKDDIARGSTGALKGTVALKNIIESIIGKTETMKLIVDGTIVDQVIAIIAFNEDVETIKTELLKLKFSDELLASLLQAIEEDQFSFVKGTAHISAAAARKLIPHLESGMNYSEACEACGWDHSEQKEIDIDAIKSPVARKAAREMLKLINVLEREYGTFDQINIEMARDVGKSIEERGKIERGLKKRTSLKEESKEELKEKINRDHFSGEDVLRYELWKEQSERCLYSGEGIPLADVVASNNRVEVDHILPWSRFGDNSFHNKTLCFATANAQKGNKTPFEWLSEQSPDEWDRYVAEVESNKKFKGLKKRNYLLMNADERETAMRSRNLNDTRYACRVVLGALRKKYPDEDIGKRQKRRRVFARPGAVIAVLRRAWGLESLKKDDEGNRVQDDRHHALDAILVACCTEGLLQYATRQAQIQEKRSEKFELRKLPTPWGTTNEFRNGVKSAVVNVFVSRPERGRLRGEGHQATIKRIRYEDDKAVLSVRKSIFDLTLKDLDNIPVPKPYGNIVDPEKLRNEMVASLRKWIEEGKKPNDRPRSPKGDLIKKVRINVKDKKAVEVRGGSADQANIVRTDVFSQTDKNGKTKFYLVPIYRSDVYTSSAELKAMPPNRAIVAHKACSEWPIMDDKHHFKFSLYPYSLIEIIKPDGEVIFGYFRGVDSSTANITISKSYTTEVDRKGDRHGSKTVKSFKKHHVDSLGRYFEVKGEKRTWRGKVCT